MRVHAFEGLDLASADEVCRVLRTAGEASRDASCRRGSIDWTEAPGVLIATGDIHDNPLHLSRVIEAAGLHGDVEATPESERSHLTLHELIHGEHLMGGMDFSYRALVRVAALKAAYPEHVHVLLANHELAQIIGSGIIKDGVRVVEAFNDGVERVFGDEARRVYDAIAGFVRSMPLALRCDTPRGVIQCSHSVPSPAMMGRFDVGILDRDLTEADYQPLTGSAHMMVWGRHYDAESLEDLVERWGVTMFILGHEKVPEGARFVPPCAVVLNSDHANGVYLPIDLTEPPDPQGAPRFARRLAQPVLD
ncbi:MAG: metallophosphoesterase [Phycisphaeraceae bacterium]|nr:metallophosphoesterase [Phycisphaeraceae bacterium]